MYLWPNFGDCQWFDFKAGTKRYYLFIWDTSEIFWDMPLQNGIPLGAGGWFRSPYNENLKITVEITQILLFKKIIILSLFLDNLREGQTSPVCIFFTLQNSLNQFAVSNSDRNPEVL